MYMYSVNNILLRLLEMKNEKCKSGGGGGGGGKLS